MEVRALPANLANYMTTMNATTSPVTTAPSPSVAYDPWAAYRQQAYANYDPYAGYRAAYARYYPQPQWPYPSTDSFRPSTPASVITPEKPKPVISSNTKKLLMTEFEDLLDRNPKLLEFISPEDIENIRVAIENPAEREARIQKLLTDNKPEVMQLLRESSYGKALTEKLKGKGFIGRNLAKLYEKVLLFVVPKQWKPELQNFIAEARGIALEEAA